MRHIVHTDIALPSIRGFDDTGDINNKMAKILRNSAVKLRLNFSRKNGDEQ